MTLRNRIGEDATVDELESIENIVDVAFWQLMLVDDLAHRLSLIELLVSKVRERFDGIVEAAGGRSIEELAAL